MKRCPICERPYEKGDGNPQRRSRHHLFPRRWYMTDTTVYVCQKCHDEFHYRYPLLVKWSKRQSILFWIEYCESLGKNAHELYPQLKDLLKDAY